MSFHKSGTMTQYLEKNQKLNETQTKCVCIQLLLAIDLFSKLNIIHRDLKLDNILLDSYDLDIRVADFGLSILAKDTKSAVPCGTPGYIAPEIFKDQPYTHKVDVFSVGCIAYKLLTCESLFEGNDPD